MPVDVRKRIAVVAVPLLVVSIGLGAFVAQQTWQARNDEQATAPLVDVAESFPVPPGSSIAFPRTVDSTPPTVVKGWKNEGATIDEACSYWRDAFRSWMGSADPDSISGSVIPGQSCSLSGNKTNVSATLIVAVYGSEPPQATLTVTE